MDSLGEERSWAEIDLGAVRHNARVARDRIGAETELLAVVKANGYGHGAVEIAQALRQEAALFGVANLREARQLRERERAATEIASDTSELLRRFAAQLSAGDTAVLLGVSKGRISQLRGGSAGQSTSAARRTGTDG